jgi:hypothetical protein
MDRVTLQQRLEEVERLIAREERNVTHQNGMIETLERWRTRRDHREDVSQTVGEQASEIRYRSGSTAQGTG